MGKGDKKSKRGKIILGSYGVRRRKKGSKITSVQTEDVQRIKTEPEGRTPVTKKKLRTTASH